jgi:hypothetical protein
VITDPLPRAVRKRRQYEASDAHHALALPTAGPLERLTNELGEALAGGERADVARVGLALLGELSGFYAVPLPGLSVLGTRPHRVQEGRLSFELFGDYTLESQHIRVWMRTAIRGKVTSHRGLLNTLIHEFCHHLDVAQLGYPDTPHTRGFYTRIDALYHHALGTPPEKRKPLVWIPMGARWRVDWRKLR